MNWRQGSIIPVIVLLCSQSAYGQLSVRRSLENHSDAVCNDGSAASYFFREGRGANAARWLICLEGGGGCGSVETCNQRWNYRRELMTSGHLQSDRRLWGIQRNNEQSNPDLFNPTRESTVFDGGNVPFAYGVSTGVNL